MKNNLDTSQFIDLIQVAGNAEHFSIRQEKLIKQINKLDFNNPINSLEVILKFVINELEDEEFDREARVDETIDLMSTTLNQLEWIESENDSLDQKIQELELMQSSLQEQKDHAIKLKKIVDEKLSNYKKQRKYSGANKAYYPAYDSFIKSCIQKVKSDKTYTQHHAADDIQKELEKNNEPIKSDIDYENVKSWTKMLKYNDGICVYKMNQKTFEGK